MKRLRTWLLYAILIALMALVGLWPYVLAWWYGFSVCGSCFW